MNNKQNNIVNLQVVSNKETPRSVIEGVLSDIDSVDEVTVIVRNKNDSFCVFTSYPTYSMANWDLDCAKLEMMLKK